MRHGRRWIPAGPITPRAAVSLYHPSGGPMRRLLLCLILAARSARRAARRRLGDACGPWRTRRSSRRTATRPTRRVPGIYSRAQHADGHPPRVRAVRRRRRRAGRLHDRRGAPRPRRHAARRATRWTSTCFARPPPGARGRRTRDSRRHRRARHARGRDVDQTRLARHVVGHARRRHGGSSLPRRSPSRRRSRRTPSAPPPGCRPTCRAGWTRRRRTSAGRCAPTSCRRRRARAGGDRAKARTPPSGPRSRSRSRRPAAGRAIPRPRTTCRRFRRARSPRSRPRSPSSAPRAPEELDARERVLEVREDVLDVLDADRDAHEARA